jgi:hypothetical protein
MTEKIMEIDGRKYEIIFGSDIIHDGVYLELSDVTGKSFEVLAVVFYYDEIGKIEFNCYKERMPYQLIKWLMDEVEKKNWPI